MEFTDDKKTVFKTSLAQVAGVSVKDVTIDKVEILGIETRRLLSDGIIVTSSVKASSQKDADAITEKLTVEAINTQLSRAGLPEATMIEAPTVILQVSESDSTSGEGSADNMVVIGVIGGVVGLMVLIGAAVWSTRRQVMPQTETDMRQEQQTMVTRMHRPNAEGPREISSRPTVSASLNFKV